MNKNPNTSTNIAELRRHAEARLTVRQRGKKSVPGPERLLHELEVHQIELQMQNAELQKTRDELEVALENYTDLYDFAPVGYLSIDDSGMILETNLTGAAMLGIERSRLINRSFLLYMPAASRPIFLAFLQKVFAGFKDPNYEAPLVKEGVGTFWAGFRAASALSLKGTRKWCRVAFADITSRKQAEEAQRHMQVLTVANVELKREIVRRLVVEQALRKSEQHYAQLLEHSRHMQDQLRLLSRQVLSAQEEERKRISRELHDVVGQSLSGISVQLATLKIEESHMTKDLGRKLNRTHQLVEQSVNIVHQFARELRPSVLDDLGLIPALHAFMKNFTERTGIRVSLSAFARVEQVSNDKLTVLYRIAQEALTNIARHAKASRAEVNIQHLDRAVCMTIKDDGRGFRTEHLLHGQKKNRLGLVGMRERVQMVGGNFSIQSAPGKGTTVLAQIPLSERRARAGERAGKICRE